MGRIPKGRNSAVVQWTILGVTLVLVAIIGYLYVGPHLDGGSGEPMMPGAEDHVDPHRRGPSVEVDVKSTSGQDGDQGPVSIFGDDTPPPPKMRPRSRPRTRTPHKPPEKPKPTEETEPKEEPAAPDEAGSGGMTPTEEPTEPTETPTEPSVEPTLPR